MVTERRFPVTLPGDLENGVGDGGLNRGAAVVPHAAQPVPGLEEGDVDLRRILVDARQRECVEVVLHDPSVFDMARLVHRVVPEPRDLALDLFPHRQRIDEASPFLLIETVWTIALIVAVPPPSAPRSSSAMARATPGGSGVPQPDISAAMS